MIMAGNLRKDMKKIKLQLVCLWQGTDSHERTWITTDMLIALSYMIICHIIDRGHRNGHEAETVREIFRTDHKISLFNQLSYYTPFPFQRRRATLWLKSTCMRRSSISTLSILKYASSHAFRSSNSMNAYCSESPVILSRITSQL